MTSVMKFIGGEECECFEFSDPFYGDSRKMRLSLEGTFNGDINRESIILVPFFLSESELAAIGDLWLSEQEKELGLPLGESCTSSAWWAGSSDESKDKDITDKYDFLIPVVLANQEAQSRIQCEIELLYRDREEIEKELQAEHEDGETDWASQLEVKLEDLERLISEHEDLLKQSMLLTIGTNVAYCGYSCEIIHMENNVIYLQENTSDLHFECSIPAYLNSNPYVYDVCAPKPSLNSQIQSASIRAVQSDNVPEKHIYKFTFTPYDYETAKAVLLSSKEEVIDWKNDGYACRLERSNTNEIYYDLHLTASSTTIMSGEIVEVLGIENNLVKIRVPNDENQFSSINKSFFEKNFSPIITKEHNKETLPKEPEPEL